ncbi:MAG: host specificity factor TipJ family phage tail protein [Beijerinckiaceae bacterium]
MKTHLITRDENGEFQTKSFWASPMQVVINHIPDGVPFRIYIGSIGDDTEVTEDFERLQLDAEYFVIESPGGGAVGAVFSFVGKILNPILKLLMPSQKTSVSAGLSNQQAESPNNSLTDRTNKARPYERTYDICGTVQSIPSILMTNYQLYNSAGRVIEYGYYDVGRGPLATPASGITDGDTLLSEISGSSAAVYGPYTSPNSGDAPQTLVGDPITEPLFITYASNEIDGATLKAPNDINANLNNVAATARRNGSTGTITDPTGDAAFEDFIEVGDLATFTHIIADPDISPTDYDLSGTYPVLAVSDVDITVDISANLTPWTNMGAEGVEIPLLVIDNDEDPNALISPGDTYTASLTDWTSITIIKPERLLVNISADNGMYKDSGASSKRPASVTAEVQYQLLDSANNPYGDIYAVQGTVSGRSPDSTGVSIIADLPFASKVRVRARRVTDADFDFEGQVVDEIKYDALYGQIRDTTTHYGNRTTVHTARKQTARATSVKSPKLALIVTEKLYKYLGGGVFDTVLTENTQAVQSLIRLLNDPIVGGITLSAANMDKLLATQAEVESYFGSALAGQFCYTFDSYETTAQDIITTIAEAIFCSASRRGHNIYLDLERPRAGPEMVFTHRSKAPSGEKWTRQFNDKSAYDSLKFSYIDPDTNVKETIQIPESGGVKTDTYDSKGIRNYQQAYWHAWRRYQRNSLNRVAVEFTALEEGALAVPGRPISVVKGSRVAPYDGYVISVNGLVVNLSQPVEFTPEEDHSLILKKRDGSVQSVGVTAGANPRQVVMLSAPAESIYTGNDALKTEFSFGSDARHSAQMILVSTITPGSNRTVTITGYNYSDGYYEKDGVSPFGRAFSTGFDTGFS